MQPDLLTLTVPQFARAMDYAGAWAIEPERGAKLWDRMRGIDLAAHVANAETPKLRAEAPTVAVGRQNVAVVMLTGILMKQVSSADNGTSTVAARREIRKAANDPKVDAILIAIESPGGTVSGTFDLGVDVAAAAKRKPVYAFVDDLCASAAYWIASQADAVFANADTALVGSIGTFNVVYDLSGAAKQAGIQPFVFRTGPIKGSGTPGEPISDEQRAYWQDLVDNAQVSFDAAVRRGRGLTPAQLEAAKTGGVFPAPRAMDMKLIDGIQSFDQTLQDLAAEVRRRQRDSSSTPRADGPDPIRSATMSQPTNPTVATDESGVASIRAEAVRIATINQVAAKFPAIARQAIAEGWEPARAESASLREELKQATGGVVAANPGSGPNFIFGRGQWQPGTEAAPGVSANEAIEAAVRMTLGSPRIEQAYKPEVLQAARESFNGASLHTILVLAAAQNGYPIGLGHKITQGNLKGLLKAAFRDDAVPGQQASSTTITAAGILGAVANKELRDGYAEEDGGWSEIAVERSVSNFQAVTSYRMLDDMIYEEVGPDGKIKHGSTDEESYTRQAKTYAKMFTITRQQWINDDLGAFQDIRDRLGRGGSRKLRSVFWKKFLDNSTFFTTARTNYISGSTTNLGTDGVGLGLGVKAFRTMTTPAADGTKRIGGAPPDRLVVPPELEANARALYVTMNQGAVKASDVNLYFNQFRPIVVPELSDPSLTGYSATAWYLFRNPASMAPMVVSFLNGNKTPMVESAEADFDTLGVQFRGVHDFGVDFAEYLAGIKSKGAA